MVCSVSLFTLVEKKKAATPKSPIDTLSCYGYVFNDQLVCKSIVQKANS